VLMTVKSRAQKVILHPTEDRWQKTEGSKNNGLRISSCATNAGKGLFALTSVKTVQGDLAAR
jgi:hypothetical protein